MLRSILAFALGLLAVSAGQLLAAESKSTPRPVPLTRPEMKELIEDMKKRTPRIPLPELTAEEKASTDERGRGYEGRLRRLYGIEGDQRGGSSAQAGAGGNRRDRPAGTDFTRNNDPNMSLSYAFKTQLFWIVSRANNCQYCQGHQESKLLRAGLSEEQIAALDGDWEEFKPAEKAAFALARKLTFQPHHICTVDIDRLRKDYTDLQILEMVFSVSGNNQINRWKEGTGVPQSSGGGGGIGRRSGEQAAAPAEPEKPHSYLTPTPDQFKNKISKVAAFALDEKGEPTRLAVCKREPLESRGEVESELEAARKRTPRLPLVDEAKAREVLGDAWTGPVPQWVRLLANFPVDGKSRIIGIKTNEEKGDLPPLLKAQAAWVIARQDGAWYAVGHAKRRMKELGQTDEQIYKLDGDWSSLAPADKALLTVAKNLAASPVVLTDDEVTAALDQAGPRKVVQMITYATVRAFFDRTTEAAGLQLEN